MCMFLPIQLKDFGGFKIIVSSVSHIKLELVTGSQTCNFVSVHRSPCQTKLALD